MPTTELAPIQSHISGRNLSDLEGVDLALSTRSVRIRHSARPGSRNRHHLGGFLSAPRAPHRQRDGFYPGILGGWTALGMDALGERVQVEASAPPYGFTHELFTDLQPQRGDYKYAHYSTVLDIYTPLFPDKTPELAGAWAYMLTAEVH